VRAPTPTAAAELASPNRADLAHKVEVFADRLSRQWLRTIESRMQHLDHLSKRLVHPGERLRQQGTQLGQIAQRMSRASQHLLEQRRWQIAQSQQRLLAAQPDLAAMSQARAHLSTRLGLATNQRIRLAQQAVVNLTAHLSHLNPQAVLERGYSIVRDAAGKVVRDSMSLTIGSEVDMTFSAGSAKAKVISR
jgi:exodeoxyribonuclease VII large subunit